MQPDELSPEAIEGEVIVHEMRVWEQHDPDPQPQPRIDDVANMASKHVSRLANFQGREWRGAPPQYWCYVCARRGRNPKHSWAEHLERTGERDG